MAGAVDRLADLGDRREAAGRGLIVQHAHRFDLMRLVVLELGLDHRRLGADAPVGRDELRLQSKVFRHPLPQRRELAGLDHEHAIAGRERVDQRRFPGAGAGRGVNDDRVGGLENRLDAVERAARDLGELRSAMIDERRIHGAQNAVGDRRRPRDLQEMTAGGTRSVFGHVRISRGMAVISCRRTAGRKLAVMKDECHSQSSLSGWALRPRKSVGKST